MATHKSAPFVTLDHYEAVVPTVPDYGFHFSKDDVQYLLDVIKEKNAEIATHKIACDRYGDMLNIALMAKQRSFT